MTNGTARKRGAAQQAGTAAGTSSSSRDQKDSRSPSCTSPTDSDYKSEEEIDSIISKLPHWVDQLGGIRNLVIGGLVLEWYSLQERGCQPAWRCASCCTCLRT
jgi:hypothetical protein